MSSSSPLSSSPPADLADAAVFDFADNPQCAVGQEHMNMCVCVTLGVIGMLLHLFLLQQGAPGVLMRPVLTKTLISHL